MKFIAYINRFRRPVPGCRVVVGLTLRAFPDVEYPASISNIVPAILARIILNMKR
jgi:hypothetical protein